MEEGAPLEIVFLLFDGITPLDAVGPFEVLGRLPGASVKFAAKKPGLVRTKGGAFALQADYALSGIEAADVLVLPGGPGSDALAEDAEVTDWVRRISETATWTTSVCTGALILAGAGVLNGKEATTHWRAFEKLSALGATPVHRRMVREGNVVTAAGVSAGIDMALWLAAEIAGKDIAEAIQLGLEYAPEPPFDAGDFPSAPESRVTLARTGLNRP